MVNNDEFLHIIKSYLTRRHQTVAVAESVTTGLLQSCIGSCEEASKFFQGGLTVYNLGQKCRHLGIDPISCLECNSVSENIAIQMAAAVGTLFTSDWGIAITGYATPVPESENQLFAFFAITFQGQVKQSCKLETALDVPAKVQSFYVDKIIEEFVNLLAASEKSNQSKKPSLK